MTPRSAPRIAGALLLLLAPACGGAALRSGPGTTTTWHGKLRPVGPTSTTAPPTTTTSTTSTTTTTVPPTTTTVAPTTTTVAPTTTTTPPAPAVTEVLGAGDGGQAVAELQDRLRELHFWIGSEDGFGWLTEQAVFAFQKANGITVDGRVGPETRAALAGPAPLSPRSEDGRVLEIDKGRQLAYAVLDGEVQWVFHTSTGTEEPYAHPDGRTAMADTPPGHHTVYYQVDGWQDGVLGPMYRPKYFHQDGIALHGYDAVPPYPASHGCARVTFPAIDFIWANDLMPIGSTVLVYGETPPPGEAV